MYFFITILSFSLVVVGAPCAGDDVGLPGYHSLPQFAVGEMVQRA